MAEELKLTEREREVMTHVATGVPYKVVASKLNISEKGVMGALNHAKIRNCCNSVLVLMLQAARQGVV